jgi:hypothetical protein
MFRVDDIYDEAKKIIGICDDTKLFRWLGDAASIIVNKADLEGLKGYLDICTAGGCSCSGTCRNECGSRCVTLPREVETVLGVNMNGHPSLGFGQLFSFHLNGPGDCKKTCDWSWQDKGDAFCTYRDLIIPAKLVAYLQSPDDNGKQLIVYGYDSAGNVLRRQVSGVWLDGYQVPTIYGLAVPDVEAPTIARITRIFKEPTVGQIRLSTIDDSGPTGVLLGVYEPDETMPQYRRIQLNRSCQWVRIAYMRSSPLFHSRWDHIPLRSRLGFLLALQARKEYGDKQLPEAHAFEADAARLEIEAQQKLEAPLAFPLQVNDRNNLNDKSDWQVS